jgi:nitroreductase
MKTEPTYTDQDRMMQYELFLELVHRRQSVRGYTAQAVEPAKIRRCVEAARLAPSACNSQPWRFIVVDQPTLKNQLADLTAERWLPFNHWTKQAPVHVVIVMEAGKLTSRIGAAVKKRDFPWIGVGIAAEHFCLQAAAEGLGTCMLGWFKEAQVKQLLAIPESRRVGLLITLGYPADGTIRPKIRKPMDDILCWNRWG